MTVVELKEKIHKAVDAVPEASLEDVLRYVEKAQHSNYISEEALNKHLDDVIEENHALLQRLAK